MRQLIALFFLLLALPCAASEPPQSPGPWVVEARFETPMQLWQATREFAPWQRRDDVLVLEVPDRYSWQRLQRFGLTLSVDRQLTDLLQAPPARGSGPGIPGFPCYRTVVETYASAQKLASDYPDLAQWLPIGDSWEQLNGAPGQGQTLYVLRLGRQDDQPRPALFAMAAMHARELTTAELLTRFAEYLLAGYGSDPDITWMLDEHEVHLLLQANPDGRRQAQLGELWRKNTNQSYCGPTSSQRGADLNRNYPFAWGGAGASTSACNQTYRGSGPASEPETQAVRDYVRELFPAARPADYVTPAPADTAGVFIDVHSFGGLLLWPWGELQAAAPNAIALEKFGRRLAWFNGYEAKPAVQLYPTSGTTTDFAYGERGVAAFTYELGSWFFEQCDAFESTVLQDNLQSLFYALRVARAPYQLPAGPDLLSLRPMSSVVERGEPLRFRAQAVSGRYNSQGSGSLPGAAMGAQISLINPPWSATAVIEPFQLLSSAPASTIELEVDVATDQLRPGTHLAYSQAEDLDANLGPVYSSFFSVVEPGTTGLLFGRVTGATGEPVSASLQSLDSSAEAADDGLYRLRIVPGVDQLTISATGYLSRSLSIPPLAAGSELELNIVLQPDCGDQLCDLLFSHGFEASGGSQLIQQ